MTVITENKYLQIQIFILIFCLKIRIQERNNRFWYLSCMEFLLDREIYFKISVRIIMLFLENCIYMFLVSFRKNERDRLGRVLFFAPHDSTPLDNALKIQSKTIPSQNYSKQRSLRSWPARPSSFPFVPLSFSPFEVSPVSETYSLNAYTRPSARLCSVKTRFEKSPIQISCKTFSDLRC